MVSLQLRNAPLTISRLNAGNIRFDRAEKTRAADGFCNFGGSSTFANGPDPVHTASNLCRVLFRSVQQHSLAIGEYSRLIDADAPFLLTSAAQGLAFSSSSTNNAAFDHEIAKTRAYLATLEQQRAALGGGAAASSSPSKPSAAAAAAGASSSSSSSASPAHGQGQGHGAASTARGTPTTAFSSHQGATPPLATATPTHNGNAATPPATPAAPAAAATPSGMREGMRSLQASPAPSQQLLQSLQHQDDTYSTNTGIAARPEPQYMDADGDMLSDNGIGRGHRVSLLFPASFSHSFVHLLRSIAYAFQWVSE